MQGGIVMEWLPDFGVGEYDNEFLNDFELHKVKELRRSWRSQTKEVERKQIQIEIYNVYKEAIGRHQEEKIKYKKEKIWNEMLQKAFDRMSRIMANLLGTLMASGIIILFFVVLFGLNYNSTSNLETALAPLLQVSVLMSVISIVVGVVSYKKMRKLKKQFETGDMAVEIAKNSSQE